MGEAKNSFIRIHASFQRRAVLACILSRWCSGYTLALGRGWTCWDVGPMRGGAERCWEEGFSVKVSCRLPRGAFLQFMCSQNTWWKVKVQWGLRTRIMLCRSVTMFSPPLLFSPSYLFVALPSGHSCEDRSRVWAAPLTPLRFNVQHLHSFPFHTARLV